MPLYKKEDILAVTNNGLDIITHYYPDAAIAAEKNKKFRMRADEKTPSATVRFRNGMWRVCDFGGGGNEMNPFDLAMQEEGISDYGAIMKKLAEFYHVAGENGEQIEAKAGFEKRPATAEEKEGEYYFKFREHFTDIELKTLGRFVKEEHCHSLHCYSLESYTYIKNREALTFISNDNFPQYIFDWGEFKKLYRPKEMNKAMRFLYIGEKPKDFIYGMDYIKKSCAEYSRREGDDKDGNAKVLPEIIIASGERDALNIASAELFPIWKNSESANLSRAQYDEITMYCDRLVNMPDIDATGVREAHQLGLKFLEMATAWLPAELKMKKDWRGNPCKDVTDYMQFYSVSSLKYIVKNALCFQPWEKIVEMDKEGNIKEIKYVLNNAQAYEFLYANGFHRIEKKNDKTGFTFIRITKNVVEEIKPSEIKFFVHKWLKANGYEVKLRNMFYRTTQLNEASLNGNLDVAELDFSDHDKNSQLFFFKNKIIKCSKDGYDASSTNNFVWADEVIDYTFRKLPPFFTWSENEGKLQLDSLDESFSIVRFLMNTSRVFWRKEQDKTITDEEKHIQQIHFLNKCFAIGYLLHRYKNPSRPWAVFAVDSRDGALGEANGGSGKSITFKMPAFFMKHITLNGRDKDLTKNAHIFDRVNENTDFVLVDDANGETDFHFFFTFLTGPFPVNPKHASQFEIPFTDSPKFAFTSNHILRKIDQSVERRLLYTVFSDYYHKKDSRGVYAEDRSPADEFGKNLIDDFTPEEMNQFFNFMLQCCQFYMTYGRKLDPPMDNVEKRILRTQMGDNFLEWANVYFAREEKTGDNQYLNCRVSKKELFEAYRSEYSDNYTKPNKFKEKLMAFCDYMGYEFNPVEMCSDRDNRRIIAKGLDGKSEEFIYIDTCDGTMPEIPKPVEDLSVKDDLDM